MKLPICIRTFEAAGGRVLIISISCRIDMNCSGSVTVTSLAPAIAPAIAPVAAPAPLNHSRYFLTIMRRDCSSDDNENVNANTTTTSSASDDEMKAAIHLASLVKRNQKSEGREGASAAASASVAATGADDDGSESSWSVGETSNNVPGGGNESQKPPMNSEMQEDARAAGKDLNRFPNKLMHILDSKVYEEIFSWNKEGNAIVIHKPYDLISHVLTRHFGAKEDMRFDSFLRKLYRWGFSKHLEEGCNDEGEHIYCHNHFRRGDYASCSKVKCTSKPSSRRIPAREIHPHERPNLDNLQHLYAGILQPSVNPMGSMGSTCSHYVNHHVPHQTNLGNTDLLLQQLSVAVAQQRQRSQQTLQQQQQNQINAATLQQLVLSITGGAGAGAAGTTPSSTSSPSPSQSTNGAAVSRAIESALVNREIERIKHENNLLSQLATNLQQNIATMNQQVQALTAANVSASASVSASANAGNSSSADASASSSSAQRSQAILNELYQQAAFERVFNAASATATANNGVMNVGGGGASATGTATGTGGTLSTGTGTGTTFHGQRRERDDDSTGGGGDQGGDGSYHQDPQLSPSGKQRRRLS